MKLLVLGGSQFVGRWIVETALERGHTLTLFNRGKTNPHLFPNVEKIIGDRDGELDKLNGRTWDAVIDVSGYVPRVVRASAEALKDKVQHYTFVSTISVYDTRENLTPNKDENAPLARLEDETVEEITGETYGGLKVLCEQAVMDVFPDNYLIPRPGLIVGAYDHTQRFPYWVARIAKGGEVLAFAPEHPIQFIDARDLADWTIQNVEAQTTGIYNLTGPDYPLTIGDMLKAIRDVTRSDAEMVYVDEAFLQEHEIMPFSDLPFHVPSMEFAQSIFTTNIQKALDTGLTIRPLEDTIQDTWEWRKDLDVPEDGTPGLLANEEGKLLQVWHSESGE